MNEKMHPDPAVAFGAQCFWWIAGFAVVSLALLRTDAEWGFVAGIHLGLGLTTFANLYLATPIALTVVVATLAFYGYVGLLAARGKGGAFFAGLVAYGLDTLLIIYFEAWLAIAFRAFVVYLIVKGMLALNARSKTSA